MLDVQAHYWPRYCEENVWHLCQSLPPEIVDPHAVFVSNLHRKVAMWHQRTATAAGAPVVWDYHVVLLGRTSAGWQVWDADSTLATPSAADRYLEACFPDLAPESAALRPRFRVVSAQDYRRELGTDRSHMRAAEGRWLSAPPPGPAIGQGTNLMRFVDTRSDFVGFVCDLPELRAWLEGRSAPA